MSKRPRILCLVPWLPDAASILLERDNEVDYCPQPDRTLLLERIADYDAVWVHFENRLDREVLDRAPRLRVIGTATTGTDHIDKSEAARRGITVLSTATDYALLESFTATAECAWMLLLGCYRRFRTLSRAALAGDWADAANQYCGEQLSRQTLGVLGVGRLGRMVAAYGLAFRMRVLGCDLKEFDVPGVERVDHATLWRESDAISIHIHLTPENRNLLNAEVFGQMKPGTVLVNTSRGDLLDETALLAALDSGRIGAYGADVVSDEWRPDMAEHPLVRYARENDNVILTPHIGGATRLSVHDSRLFFAEKLDHWLRTGTELKR